MSLTEQTRISFQMPAFGWLLVADALEKYMTEHLDLIGTDDLDELIDCINRRVDV